MSDLAPMTIRRASVVKRLAPYRQRLYAVAGPSPELAGFLNRHRINQHNVEAYCGLLTVALVKIFGDNRTERVFQFDPDGIPAVVIEAFEADAFPERVKAAGGGLSLRTPQPYSGKMAWRGRLAKN